MTAADLARAFAATGIWDDIHHEMTYNLSPPKWTLEQQRPYLISPLSAVELCMERVVKETLRTRPFLFAALIRPVLLCFVLSTLFYQLDADAFSSK